MIRKSGKIRAANSRIDQMTSLSLDFYILYSMIDGIYTLLVPTRPLQLLPSTALTTQLRMISIRVASVCKSSDLPFSLTSPTTQSCLANIGTVTQPRDRQRSPPQ